MRVLPTDLPEVLIVEPRVFGDRRGSFHEAYNRERYREAGIDVEFVQDNVSLSAAGVIRGIHFQEPRPQAKLVSVLRGRVRDYAIDLRIGSPTWLRWVAVDLDGESFRQIFVPAGFGHAFACLEDDTVLAYKCSAPYDPDGYRCVRWNDPRIAIDWPVETPLLSTQDAAALTLDDFSREQLPVY